MTRGRNIKILETPNFWQSLTIQLPQNKFIDKKCIQNNIKNELFENKFESSFKPKYNLKLIEKS